MPQYFSCVFIDAFGRRTARRYEIEDQTLKADYDTLAAAVADDIEALTDLGLVSMTLLRPMSETFAVTAGANVDVGGTFTGLVDGVPAKNASTKMPGIKLAKVSGDGTIDITDVDVDAWLDRFLASGGDLLLSDGEQMASWTKGTLDK